MPLNNNVFKKVHLPLWNEQVTGDSQPFLEFYPIDDNIIADTVLVIPGGGYRYVSYRESERIAYAFNQMGFHAAILTYRCSTKPPEPQKDALRAIKILRSKTIEWNLYGKIAVCGFSAGGHLAATCGLLWNDFANLAINGDEADKENARPDAVILGYPVISFGAFAHLGSVKNLLGDDNNQDEREYFSLEKHVIKNCPPFFLWHTATDQIVPYQNSVLMAQALWEQKIVAELHIFPRGEHGTALAPHYPEASEWINLAKNFLIISCGFKTATRYC